MTFDIQELLTTLEAEGLDPETSPMADIVDACVEFVAKVAAECGKDVESDRIFEMGDNLANLVVA